MGMFIAGLLALLAVVGGGIWLWRSRSESVQTPIRTSQMGVAIATERKPAPDSENGPCSLAIGLDPEHPLIAIEPCPSTERYARATPVPPDDSTIGRLSSLLQAVPSVLVAAEAQGKQLMEVVINGGLTQASDGNGLRAFAMGPNGIQEHARLFEVSNLSTMINAAAVWQVASVIVAQKHLADINAKLTDIADAIAGVSDFLESQRRARINGTLEYLRVAAQALREGELSASVRGELESCDRDLTEILHHLEAEYQRIADRRVSDSDRFGSAGVTSALKQKMTDLTSVGTDIALGLKTRIAAWHVLSLFPGEPALKKARRDAIVDCIERTRGLPNNVGRNLASDLSQIESIWNSKDTLAARREEVQNAATHAIALVHDKASDCATAVDQTDQLFLTHQRPTRFLFEVSDKRVLGIRQEILPLAA